MGGTIDTSVNKGRGPNVYRLHGHNCHRIGSLLPPPGKSPKYNQLEKRTGKLPKSKILRDDIVEDIKNMLNDFNPYSKILRTTKDRFQDTASSNVQLKLISRRTACAQSGKTYNLPTTSEVAALYVGDFDLEMEPRDIILETMEGKLKRISELHAGYLPLQYPLLFPFGEDGYHIYLELKRTTSGSTNPRTRLNQKALRVNKYVNVEAAADKGNMNTSKVGRRMVLPSTFIGSAQCTQEIYMDAMAVCQHFGYPDLFITFTCNPKWPEITRYLQARGHQSTDIADIVSRIFKIKLDTLIVDIKKNNVFGPATAVLYTIEFQKRGLPHVHILLFLQKGSKLITTDVIDNVISAEIPDEATNPTLYNVVKEFMIHGLCGVANPHSPCMDKGKCTKKFPKEFNSSTCINKDGFPVYKRRDDGRSVEKNGTLLDNRYIVPYNPYLLLKYQATAKDNLKRNDVELHNQVENDGSSDPVVEPVIDEIKRFYDFRYIAPCEAAWRIFGFEIHYSSVHIQRLNIHLEGEHIVCYDEDEDVDDVLAKEGNQTSHLLESMKINSSEDEELAFAK
ncbi:PREDICTED: uncharacterized protein LOC104734095 [Camelina sativa]|uniref:Uncharacterized protein LOC104734095 n=1 Tax=Camelina sativa TaxID=90675 RepID=A0ABM0V6Z4_CAMSA|nr:PREDICTED: uncharacterized protein LOC104734095 [Camelina sativa]